MRTAEGKTVERTQLSKSDEQKKRKQKTAKKDNPRVNSRS
jgi:hypothetical protein